MVEHGRLAGVAWMMVCVAGGPLHADCGAVKGNAMAAEDCSFARGVAGWEAVRGTVAHRPAEGGALIATVDEQGSLTLHGPCVGVEEGLEYRFAARLRGHAAGGYFFAFNVLEYTDAACTESSGVLAVTGAPPGEEWVELATPATISDGTRAVRFELNGSGEVGAAALFDELVIARP